jgi:LPXTG-motif cell wall-anchored protein
LPETTGETVVTEPETTTMQAASAGKGPSTGTLAILGVVLIAVFAGAAIYALRRKKPAGQS